MKRFKRHHISNTSHKRNMGGCYRK